MADIKTEFPLTVSGKHGVKAAAKIVRYGGPKSYLIIDTHTPAPYKQGPSFQLRGKSLETFAVNILKALGSKKLKK